jgi:hypothetical protein
MSPSLFHSTQAIPSTDSGLWEWCMNNAVWVAPENGHSLLRYRLCRGPPMHACTDLSMR